MNEENDKKKVLPSVAIADNKDWFLQQLIHIANISESVWQITLNVSGFLVSGTLIGGVEYFESLGNEMSRDLSAEAAKTIKNLFSSPASFYTSDIYKEKPNIGYIHLKDAKFFHPGGAPVPNNRGVLWRGRIEEVSGFSFGLLSTQNLDNDE